MATARVRVGERLRELRKLRGLSQEQLAHQIDVTQSYVGAVERAGRAVTLDTLEMLAEALGVTLGDLVAPEDLALSREVETLVQDIPSKLRGQALRTVRESILFLRQGAVELSAGPTKRPASRP